MKCKVQKEGGNKIESGRGRRKIERDDNRGEKRKKPTPVRLIWEGDKIKLSEKKASKKQLY